MKENNRKWNNNKKKKKKMSSLKKMLRGGSELLQLALILSLLRIDPDSLLLPFNNSNNNNNDLLSWSTGDIFESVLTQFLASPQSSGNSNHLLRGQGYDHHDPIIDVHPKNFDNAVERFQRELLQDLNDLGRYSARDPRIPVEISAYILSSGGGTGIPDLCAANNDGRLEDDGNGSDSGISDTEARASSTEGEDSDNEETASGGGGGGSAAMDNDFLILDPEDLENELVHIDDQLLNIEDSLDGISEEFLALDEQLAYHIQDEEEEDQLGFLSEEMLSNVDYDATPFDSWLQDSGRNFDSDDQDFLNHLEAGEIFGSIHHNDEDEVRTTKLLIETKDSDFLESVQKIRHFKTFR